MIAITEFKNKFSKQVQHIHADMDSSAFLDIVREWKHTVTLDKDTAPIFTMCRYGDKQNRTADNIVSVTGIVLDVDDGNTPEQLIKALEILEPYAHCWYTTYSSTEENPRLRILVPISSPVTAKVFKEQKLALRLADLLGIAVDACCAKPTQFYYKPTKPTADSDAEIHVGDSTELFDVKTLPLTSAKPSKTKSPAAEEDQIGIFKMVDALVHSMFDGIAPMYVGDKFHVYLNGVWHAVDAGKTFCRSIVDHHNRKISIPDALDLVFAMKIMFSCDTFPDSATNKITLANGTLNTDTGELEPHSYDNYHRSGLPFAYDPDAKCVLFLKTLDDIFLSDDDKEMKINLLQEWTGYLLTPIVKFQVMMWLYGAGANGKSVIMHVIRVLLGAENVSSIPLSQLGARFIGAELQGKLANIVDEVAANALMQEDELKKVVSGDPILVERKGKDPYFFSPTARIMAATNTLPPSKDSTHGLDRRLMLLTCNRTFKPEEMDRDLVTKLVHELPGIFNWALDGLKRLIQQGGFTLPPSSVTAMEEFKACRNSVSLFKRDCIMTPASLTLVGQENKSFRTPSTELYNTYKDYCAANRYQTFGKEGFGKKLKELGVEQVRAGGKRYYLAKLTNLEEAGLMIATERPTMRGAMKDMYDELDAA